MDQNENGNLTNLWFFATILFVYLVFDVVKIILAKQLKNKLTH